MKQTIFTSLSCRSKKMLIRREKFLADINSGTAHMVLVPPANVFWQLASAKRTIRMVTAMLVIVIVTSCANKPPRNPVPFELQDTAQVVDMPGVRVWGDGRDDALLADMVQSIRDEPAGLFPRGPNDELRYSGLALSGGGEHGAFGAAFRKGWS